MCEMHWGGKTHDTHRDMVSLTGTEQYTAVDVFHAFLMAYSAYYTPLAAAHPSGEARIVLDVEDFFRTGELPGYAFSAVS